VRRTARRARRAASHGGHRQAVDTADDTSGHSRLHVVTSLAVTPERPDARDLLVPAGSEPCGAFEPTENDMNFSTTFSTQPAAVSETSVGAQPAGGAQGSCGGATDGGSGTGGADAPSGGD
jgi:hypothetical protein